MEDLRSSTRHVTDRFRSGGREQGTLIHRPPDGDGLSLSIDRFTVLRTVMDGQMDWFTVRRTRMDLSLSLSDGRMEGKDGRKENFLD